MAVTRSSRIWAGDSIAHGNMVIDDDNAEALLIRKDGDGGDVVTFNTTTPGAGSNVFSEYVETDGGYYAGSADGTIGVYAINRVNSGTQSSYQRGFQSQVALKETAAASGVGDFCLAGIQTAAIQDATGTCSEIRGGNFAATISAGGSVVATGLVDVATGVNARVNFGSPTATGAVTDAYCLRARTPTNTAVNRTITNLYGLEIEDMVAAGITTSYAIKTGTGLVDFGDDVNVVSGSGYQVNGTQVVGTQAVAEADVAGGAGDSDGVARAKINALLAKLRTHGLIAT